MRDITGNLNGLSDLAEAYQQRLMQNSHLLLRDIFVGPRGPIGAPLLFLGDAPGAIEEERGVPFAGNSGALLDTLLRTVGVNPELMSFSNVMKFRPAQNASHLKGPQTKNRAPNSTEIAAFADLLQREVTLLEPKVIVACGNAALGWCTGEDLPITKNRGGIFVRKPNTPVIATFHPSFLLYRRQETAGFERDQVVKDIRKALKLVE